MADSLNCHEAQRFSVTQRFVRDRYNIIAKRAKTKLSKEERESGGGDSELSESEKLVEELIALSEEAEKRTEDQNEAKREAVANEKKQALEMREMALERLGETIKRNEREKPEEKKADTKRGEDQGRGRLRNQEAGDGREERRKKTTAKLHETEETRQQQSKQVTMMQQRMLHAVQQQQ